MRDYLASVHNYGWPIFLPTGQNSVDEIYPRLPGIMLRAPYPNPMRELTVFQFVLPHEEEVRLDVVDVSGRVVSTLMDGIYEPSVYSLTWDGSDKADRKLANGMYFLRVVAGEYEDSKSIMLVRQYHVTP
ncbi:MAG: T9SS type A sorting domain-containing protein [Candidatus Eisenbacteria sp.]|nr:T9SS type A sorting domain-containing protein [Candidatus Eisenbacteria bacterium]